MFSSIPSLPTVCPFHISRINFPNSDIVDTSPFRVQSLSPISLGPKRCPPPYLSSTLHYACHPFPTDLRTPNASARSIIYPTCFLFGVCLQPSSQTAPGPLFRAILALRFSSTRLRAFLLFLFFCVLVPIHPRPPLCTADHWVHIPNSGPQRIYSSAALCSFF